MLTLGATAAIAHLEVRIGGEGLIVRTGWGRPAAVSPDQSPATLQTASAVQRVEARLTELEGQLAARQVATVTPAGTANSNRMSDAELRQFVRQAVDESEQRQQGMLATQDSAGKQRHGRGSTQRCRPSADRLPAVARCQLRDVTTSARARGSSGARGLAAIRVSGGSCEEGIHFSSVMLRSLRQPCRWRRCERVRSRAAATKSGSWRACSSRPFGSAPKTSAGSWSASSLPESPFSRGSRGPGGSCSRVTASSSTSRFQT